MYIYLSLSLLQTYIYIYIYISLSSSIGFARPGGLAGANPKPERTTLFFFFFFHAGLFSFFGCSRTLTALSGPSPAPRWARPQAQQSQSHSSSSHCSTPPPPPHCYTPLSIERGWGIAPSRHTVQARGCGRTLLLLVLWHPQDRISNHRSPRSTILYKHTPLGANVLASSLLASAVRPPLALHWSGWPIHRGGYSTLALVIPIMRVRTHPSPVRRNMPSRLGKHNSWVDSLRGICSTGSCIRVAVPTYLAAERPFLGNHTRAPLSSPTLFATPCGKDRSNCTERLCRCTGHDS